VGIAHGVATDFDGDGDVDLFQADDNGNVRLFMENFDTRICTNCPPAGDDPYNNSLVVRLEGHAVGQYHVDRTTNTDLIGTYVENTDTGAGQWVQGHKSTSTGPSVPMVFGAGQQNLVSLSVHWPNGVITDFENLNAGQTVVLQDQSIPYVELNSVAAVKVLAPGTVDFVFEWDTVGASTEDQVDISLAAGSSGSNCYVYVTTISSQDADVTWTVTRTSLNLYHHVLTWQDQDCYPGCKLNYVVRSKNAVAQSWSDSGSITIKSCIGGI